MKELIMNLINGDSNRVLPILIERGEVGTFDLCITSPPYWNLIKYDSGKGDLSMMKGEKEFEDTLTQILKSTSRLLNKNGSLALQWEDKTIERPDGYTGEYFLCSINHAAEKAGFILYSRYIWKKFRSKPSVMYSTFDMAQSRLARPNPNFTYLFIYKRNFDSSMSSNKTEITREEWSDWGSDAVWDFSNPGSDHPTPFAPQLVDRVLKLYTAPGDKVIDIFSGGGTTLKQCIEMGRACTAIELNPKYIGITKDYCNWGQQSLAFKYIYKFEDMSKL